MSGYAVDLGLPPVRVPIGLPRKRRIVSPGEWLREKIDEQRRERTRIITAAISAPTTVGTNAVSSSSTTIALTTTANVPAGSKIWIVVGWFQAPATATLTSISDGTNTYTVDRQGHATDTSCGLASADVPVQLNSGATITATFSASVGDRKIAAMYSTGVQTGAGAAYGAVSQAQASGASAWSSTATTVLNGDILIGGCHWEDGVQATSTPSGGNTEVHDWNDGVTGSAATSVYQLGTGASIAAQGTWTANCGSAGMFSVAVAYTAAAAAGPVALASIDTDQFPKPILRSP